MREEIDYVGKEVSAVLGTGAQGCDTEGREGRALQVSTCMVEGNTACIGRRVKVCGWPIWRWLSSLTLVFVLGLVFTPSYSYALEPDNYLDGPFVTGQTVNDKGYVVCNCSNRYKAALTLIGRISDFGSLTSDQLAKLSNESSGGAFYTLASGFIALGADGSANHYVGWWGDVLYQQNMVSINGGYGNTWAIETNSSAIASALEDYMVIYGGGSLGGGGGSGGSNSDGQYYYFDFTGRTGYQNSSFASVDGVALYKNYAESIAKAIDDNSSLGLNLWISFGGYNGGTDPTVLVQVENSLPFIDSNNRYSYRWPVGSKNFSTVYPSGGAIEAGVRTYVEHDGKRYAVCFYNFNEIRNFPVGDAYTGTNNAQFPVFSYYYGSISGDTNNPAPTPPSQWPDTPTTPTPTAPTVPDVPDTTPTTQPTTPSTPSTPVYPTQITYEGDTYVTADLQAVLDAMDEHCIHLQDAIYRGFNDYYTSITQYFNNQFQTLRSFLYGQFGYLGDVIIDEIGALKDYLKELFEWLADEIDFSVTGGVYNDSSVIYWLRQIYSKLGTGTRIKPVDPVTDPDGLGKWLMDLWNNFLIDLVAVGSNAVGALAEELQILTLKFPFSLPWDIAALLALLSADPVAPSFDVPMFTVTSGGSLQRLDDAIHVDLAVYETYWAPVRTIEKIAFAVYLAANTKGFMELLGLATSKE